MYVRACDSVSVHVCCLGVRTCVCMCVHAYVCMHACVCLVKNKVIKIGDNPSSFTNGMTVAISQWKYCM